MTVQLAFECDGAGEARKSEVEGKSADQLVARDAGFVWVHLERPVPESTGWMSRAGLESMVMEVLDAPETRPRCTVHGDGVMMNLRGVNLSEGARPEDMVSLRLWVTERLVVSVQRRRVRAVEDVAEGLVRSAPRDSGELVARLALRLADRAEPVVAELNERVDDLEGALQEAGRVPARGELAEVRRVAIVLRRYMFPMRDALTTLAIEDMIWLSGPARERVREAAERVTRLGEELDAIRDRAEVVHDQIMDMRAEAANRQMLILAVVAAVFLPLGLITGLLGINVAGVPGTEWSGAFWVVCALLVGIGGALVWLFRRWGLL